MNGIEMALVVENRSRTCLEKFIVTHMEIENIKYMHIALSNTGRVERSEIMNSSIFILIHSWLGMSTDKLLQTFFGLCWA